MIKIMGRRMIKRLNKNNRNNIIKNKITNPTTQALIPLNMTIF